MTRTILFRAFEYSNGLLSIPFEDEQQADTITFSLPHDWEMDNDIVAMALTTLVGTKYEEIRYGSAIYEETHRHVEALTKASWEGPTRRGTFSSERAGANYALNFSGGFDSLAALCLLPPGTKLISLDFGGPYSREKEFFKDFPVHSISTNFRDLGFNLNTWAFMGIGTILLKNYLELGSYGFGAILEASAWHFNLNIVNGELSQPWFNRAGLSLYNPVLGMTEVGTAMIIMAHRPELAARSLRSVADVNSLKYIRKLILLHAAQKAAKLPVELTPVDTECRPMANFGSNFANDFLSIYIHRYLGEPYSRILVGEIPQEILEATKIFSLKFYERFNTNFYAHRDLHKLSRTMECSALAGCTPYTWEDWNEFATIKELLRAYHPFPV